jgi:predicted ferric reductase
MPSDDMLQQLSRAAGLSTYVVLWADMCLGVALTGRIALPLLPRWRMGDLHQFTGLLALGLLATHVAVLVGLKEQAFTIPELLVPLARQINPLGPLLGIAGLYVIVLVSVISHARRYVGLRLWRLVHTFSFVGFGLALGHALAAGPDAAVPGARALYIGSMLILALLTVRRVERVVGRTRSVVRVIDQ